MNNLKITFVWCLCVLIASCSSLQIQPPATSNASTSTQTTPVTNANRVVALTPLTADIVHRLDKTKLVGMSGSRLLNENPEFSGIARVSEGRSQPNLEKIVALKPDLVIGAIGFHDPVLEKLKSLGVATIATQLDSWQSLEALTQQLAERLQTDPVPLLKTYQNLLPAQASESVSTLVLASRQPLLTPNKTSWAGDLISKFGAANLVADLQGQSPMKGYVTLSPEKVLQANPEVLILVDVEGGDVNQFKSEPFWKDLKAVKNNRVYILDYYGFVNAGSIDAIAKACSQLKQIYVTQ
ncbi:MAG: ABC transporter substrate-binding protein [Leptolyngbyaceae cyanobacterium RU_5_1]|nr:ABC transporter substrate-binding protein [Leptolyngbyaceae cyanobacterium RU_5_1]